MVGKPGKILLTAWHDDAQQPIEQLWDEIEARFGICPSFFKLAQYEPPIARNLFRQAEFAYLDNPMRALEETPEPLGDWPDFDSDLGRRFRVACAVVFLDTGQAAPWLRELLRLLGPRRYEQLMLFLAFIRTAHFWTQVHPELAFEPDLEAMLREHKARAVSAN